MNNKDHKNEPHNDTPHRENPNTDIAIDTITDQMVRDSIIYTDLSQDCIITTEDKIHIWLNKYIDYIKILERENFRLAPIAIGISMLTTLVTANFENKLFNQDIWEVIYVIGAGISTIWGLKPLILKIRYWKEKQKRTRDTGEMIQEMISDLKKNSKIIKRDDQ